MEYGTVKFACLEEAIDHPLKPVVITVRCSFNSVLIRVYFAIHLSILNYIFHIHIQK